MKIKRNLKMGNVLCKNKKNQTQNTGKGPIDGIIGRCTQICPHSIGKKKHFWDKQVLETCPPCRQQPKSNDSGWSTVSLTVPDGDYHPIPPPRKKRLTKQTHVESIDSNLNKSLDYHDDEKKSMKNETKMEEVKKIDASTTFEKTLSNKTDENDLKKIAVEKKENDVKTINDSNEKEKNVEDEKTIISDENTKISYENVKISDENANISDVLPHTEEEINITVIQNTSKIGNKKSDKFFGENLSQSLSDEPVLNSENVQSKDLPDKTSTIENDETKESNNDENDANLKLDKSKDENDHHNNKIENIEDSEEMIYKINKEKGNLMFALENQLPEKGDIDPDAIPVEEEIIVPVKRETPHICDDDLLIRDILHKPYLPPLPDTIPPKKPQRDFSRYRKSLETVKSDQPNNDPSQGDDDNIISLENQIIKAPYASEEELHSEAETLPLEDSPEKKSPPPRSIKLKAQRSSEISEPNLTKSEKILRRCLSSQSYVTSDLIEEIAQQANNLSMPTIDYVPEDYTITSSNDGTSNFSPKSNWTEKKHKISQNFIDTEINSKVILNGQISAEAEAETVNLNTILNNREEYLPNYEEATGIPRHYSSTVPHTTIKKSETISSSTSSQEEPAKRQFPIDPGFHRKVSSTKEISDAIKSFLTKDDLNSKEILKLLEEEFGDLLNSSCLSDEDREVIKKLRDSAEIEINDDDDNKLIAKETEKQSEEISKTENKSTNSSNTETETVVITTEKPNLITIKLDNQFDLKSPGIINKALEAVKSGEKRRHSIDDLDSWFSPTDSSSIKESADNNNDDDDRIKYRKRETSLPNVLEDNTVVTTANTKIINGNGSGIYSLGKNDHSSLLKFLEREKANHI